MPPPLPANTRLIPAPQAQDALQDPTCLLALIERHLSPALTASLRGHRFSGCQPIDVTMSADTGAGPVECLLAAAGYPHHPGRPALAADIATLMEILHRMPRSGRVRMRLERITTDACRLFHTDTLPLRLVCTYRGNGTEWLGEDGCDRSGLGKGDNARICRDPAAIHRMPEGWAGLMKGNLWPGTSNGSPGGLVHRSPPLAPGDWRLFLSLDTVTE